MAVCINAITDLSNDTKSVWHLCHAAYRYCISAEYKQEPHL